MPRGRRQRRPGRGLGRRRPTVGPPPSFIDKPVGAPPAPTATPEPPGLPSREEMDTWQREDQRRRGIGPAPSATPGLPGRAAPTPTPVPYPRRSQAPLAPPVPLPFATPGPAEWAPITEEALRLQGILDRLAEIRERLAQPMQPAQPVQPWQPNTAAPFRYPRGVETEYGPYPYRPDYPWGWEGYEPVYPWTPPDDRTPPVDPYFYQQPRMYESMSF